MTLETYLVRQPILNQDKEIFAYEILWRNTGEHKDAAAANAIEDFFYELNNQNFLDGKTTFITVTPNLIIKNIPKMFAPDKLVLQIDDSVVIHPLASKIIYRFKKNGYKIAIRGFDFTPRYFSILDAVDYIKIDFSNLSSPSLINAVNVGSSLNKKVIAYNVDSPEACELALKLGCSLIQGASVAQQVTSKISRMDHMQSNFFQLMVAITKEEPDLDEITDIISRDVTLTFSLIKLVNSAYFALRSRVKSVKQALVILGLGQLKEWIYLLSFKDASELPEELLRMSFLRAYFCSELAPLIQNLPIAKSEAYLMGMFSTLGALLNVPLEDALTELSLSDQIKQALLTGEGECGTLYHLVLCYERADWKGLNAFSAQLGIPMNQLSQKYFECVEHVNQIWRSITSPNTEIEGESDVVEISNI